MFTLLQTQYVGEIATNFVLELMTIDMRLIRKRRLIRETFRTCAEK